MILVVLLVIPALAVLASAITGAGLGPSFIVVLAALALGGLTVPTVRDRR